MPASAAAVGQQATPLASAKPAWRRATVWVWALWGVMTLALVWFVATYRSPHPHSDEWSAVLLMEPDQPLTWQALWAQHNEHRLPAVKFALATLGRWFDADFRPAAYCMVALTSGFTALMLCWVRRLRGETTWADAAWPLLLLHFGHFEIYMNTMALNLVGGSCLALAGLALVLGSPRGLSLRGLTALGLLLAMGPLFGASALLASGVFVIWLMTQAVARWNWHDRTQQCYSVACLAAATPALVLSVVSFIGLERVACTSPAGGWETLRTLLQTLTISCCAKADILWPYAGPVVLAAGVATLFAVGRWWWQVPADRARSSAAFLFVGGFGLIALVVAIARAGLGSDVGLAVRYAWTFAPIPLGLFLISLQAPWPQARTWLPATICCLAVLGLPAQTKFGIRASRMHAAGFRQFDRDLAAGCPVAQLALNAVVHPNPAKLQERLLFIADRVRAPRYACLQRETPQLGARPIEPKLVAANQAESAVDGSWTSSGPDPYLEYELPEHCTPCMVRFTLRVETLEPEQDQATTQIFWTQTPEQSMSGYERNQTIRLPSSPEEQSCTFWVNDSVSHLRIDPHAGPCRFQILAVELLDRPVEMTAHRPVERR